MRSIKLPKMSRKAWLVLVALAGSALFLLASAIYFRTGFPLDDAWIHQTYARNLGLRGEWSFVPGQPSAGSTAPLWSLLLASAYRLGIMPYTGTYLLGIACLILLAWAGQRAFDHLHPAALAGLPWMGILLAGEWHMVWAAVSGMETPLMAALILLVCAALVDEHPKWILAAALTGLSVWVRPDGLTLLGPIIFALAFRNQDARERVRIGLQTIAAFLLFFVPYLVFNRVLAGSFWPNTFYAKQAEYAVITQTSLLERLGSLLQLPLVGVGALLLPGLLYGLFHAIREQRWTVIGLYLWWIGYTGLYALRLPVTYQHGRYLMPAMGVYFLLGWWGMALALPALREGVTRWGAPLAKAWLLSAVLVWLIFFGLGAQAYAQDVAIIETEMVDTAHWVRVNTLPEDLVAAHDIGALGYFGERNIFDLAGLISPEVIPFIRDEARLAGVLDLHQIDYLMTFPGWYPALVQRGSLVFDTRGVYAPLLGGENMRVYRWSKTE